MTQLLISACCDASPVTQSRALGNQGQELLLDESSAAVRDRGATHTPLNPGWGGWRGFRNSRNREEEFTLIQESSKMASGLDVDSVIERLLSVRGQPNNRTVQLAEGEIRALCATARCVPPGPAPGSFISLKLGSSQRKPSQHSRWGASKIGRPSPKEAGCPVSSGTWLPPRARLRRGQSRRRSTFPRRGSSAPVLRGSRGARAPPARFKKSSPHTWRVGWHSRSGGRGRVCLGHGALNREGGADVCAYQRTPAGRTCLHRTPI